MDLTHFLGDRGPYSGFWKDVQDGLSLYRGVHLVDVILTIGFSYMAFRWYCNGGTANSSDGMTNGSVTTDTVCGGNREDATGRHRITVDLLNRRDGNYDDNPSSPLCCSC